MADKWESRIMNRLTAFVVIPNKGNTVPQIFGMELNDFQTCSLCGRRFDNIGGNAVETKSMTNIVNYPWHVGIYHFKNKALSYKCGGSMIRNDMVITTGKNSLII